MRLADFERTDDSDYPRFVTRVPDVAGVEDFEFRIAGPARLVEEMLADAAIELTIDSTEGKESPSEEQLGEVRKEQRRALWELAALEDIDELLKPSPPPPERDSSVFTAIRPLSGEGTSSHVVLSNVPLPAMANLYLGGYWFFAKGRVTPASGDQDLFLDFYFPTGPALAASRRPGTSVDVVSFVYWWPLPLWFRIFGFSAGVVESAEFDCASL